MKIAVMGFGTVGSGVVELITKNHDRIVANSLQDSLDIKYILDIRDFPGSPYAELFTKDFTLIENDPEVEIVVETMGGATFAYDYVKRLLLRGKSIVTSNKELIAAKGYELMALASANSANLLFEASVGGGIPILRPIRHCLTANEITEVAGILNGTTNFILTKMFRTGAQFADALKEAQDLGYAERDPSADVDGFDSCRKICILATQCFGRQVNVDDISTEGIRNITLADVLYAEAAGAEIKLIGSAKKLPDDKIAIYVAPALVGRNSQLASVDDVFNAILVRGDALGEVVFYGRGAGKFPTASAVVADVIDAARHISRSLHHEWAEGIECYVSDSESQVYPMYVRVKAKAGAKPVDLLDAMRGKFGHIHMLERAGAPADELAFTTAPAVIKDLKDFIGSLDGFSLEQALRITDY